MFSFSNVSVANIKKNRNLILEKQLKIPVRILKQNSDIFGNHICDFFHENINNGVFPSILKKC